MRSSGPKEKKKRSRPTAKLSDDEMARLAAEAVFRVLGVNSMLELDQMLGRCPYCHGEQVLHDPVTDGFMPCLCTLDAPPRYGIA
jgi:hypothetical protein